MTSAAPMVILDLPIPARFSVKSSDFDRFVRNGAIAKFQMNPRSVVVYLRGLQPGKPLILEYQLTATMPVEVTVPAGPAYEYYDPDTKGRSRPVQLRVSQPT